MIEKFDDQNGFCIADCMDKINEVIDVVNELQLAKDVMFNRIDRLNDAICDIRNRITALDNPTYHEAPAENMQPDYVTTSYMTNGHTKEYYGQKGASVVTNHPLPAGYTITIREPEAKGE